MANVLLVGGRSAAIAAAYGGGHSVFVLSERRPLRRVLQQTTRFLQLSFDSDRRTCITTTRELLQNTAVDAVIATTERGVLLAAWIREALGVPGNSVAAAVLCRDKLQMKRAVHNAQIPCARFTAITPRTNAAALAAQLGLPFVIKPRTSSGARGAGVIRDLSQYTKITDASQMAESYVHGIEMSVESFVHAGKVIFSNLTEYILPLWSNLVPASTLPVGLRRSILELNRQVIQLFGVERGMTHLEIFLTSSGLVFGEIAARPPGGMLMEVLELAYGFDPWQTLIDLELGQKVRLPKKAIQHAGVWFLHPGAGVVRSVRGVNKARTFANVVRVECSATPGRSIEQRDGSGESEGHIVAQGPTREAVLKALEQGRCSVRIELEPNATSTSTRRRVLW
jgi:biotin carboxylase